MKEKRDILICILIFMFSLIIYYSTLCPTVSVGDSGELITACYVAGIPHPPGYPLFTILGKLFAHIPFNSVAWRVNLMSAFFGSLTVVLIFLILMKIAEDGSLAFYDARCSMPDARDKTKAGIEDRVSRINFSLLSKYVAASSASLLLAFSPIFWSQAVVAEVFTLNAFFLSLIIYILLIWRDKVERDGEVHVKFIYLFSFLFGLGLGNHQTLVLALPGFVYFIFKVLKMQSAERKAHRVKTDNALCPMPYARSLLLFIIFFLLGLSIYLYLPIRSLSNPPIDWGNPENLSNFIKVITRSQYGTFKLAAQEGAGKNVEMLAKHIFVNLRIVGKQVLWIGLVPLLIGILSSWKKDRNLSVFSLLIFLCSGIGFTILANLSTELKDIATLERFQIMPLVVIVLWIGVGFYWLLSVSRKNLAVLGIFVILIGIIPILSLRAHYRIADRSKNYICYDNAMNILSCMEKGSILITNVDDVLFPLAYLMIVEGKGRDITLYGHNANIFGELYNKNDWENLGMREKMKRRDEIDRELFENSKSPIYYYLASVDNSWLAYQEKKAKGIIYRLITSHTPEDIDLNIDWDSLSTRGYLNEDIFKDYRTTSIVLTHLSFWGNDLMRQGREEDALDKFMLAHKMGRGFFETWINLGKIYYSTGRKKEAKEVFQQAIRKFPYRVDPYKYLSEIYREEKDYESAIATLNNILPHISQEDQASLYMNLGGLNRERGDYAGAVRAFEEAAKILPERKDLRKDLDEMQRVESLRLTRLGIDFGKKELYEKSKEKFIKAIRLFSYNEDAHIGLGTVYFKLGDYDNAIESYKKAIEIDRDNEEAHDNLGSVYGKKGLYKEALEEFKIVLKINPENQKAKRNYRITLENMEKNKR